ncbi:hypothetical protein [Amycolatopsis sp. NPDC051371]
MKRATRGSAGPSMVTTARNARSPLGDLGPGIGGFYAVRGSA